MSSLKLRLILWIGCFVTLSLVPVRMNAQEKTNVYFLAGQGADHRLFDSIQLDSGFVMKHIKYTIPKRGMRMKDYASALINQIDTTNKFFLVGTSLGGMLAAEMAELVSPEKVVIISSAKIRKELPFRYRFQKYIPVFELIPRFIIKGGALVLQPIVEPDSKNNRPTFKAMMKDKDSRFLKRTIRMIVNWDRKNLNTEIVHIHGDSDKTIPIRNVVFDHRIVNGSHMMTLTRFEQINQILNEELLK